MMMIVFWLDIRLYQIQKVSNFTFLSTHRECHNAIHSGKRGYKRSLSYFEVKLLIVVIGIVIGLIVVGIGNLFRG